MVLFKVEPSLDNILNACSSLTEALSRFRGRRALVIDGDRGSLADRLAKQFDVCESAYVSTPFGPALKSEMASRSQSIAANEPVSLLHGNGEFDTVLIARCLTKIADWRGLVREAGRVLNPRGNLVVLEYGSRGTTDLQSNAVELERLLRDRDALMMNCSLVTPGADEIRTELRSGDIHHVRLMEYTTQDFRCDTAFRQAFKRECLDKIKSDLMTTLGKLGRRRDDIEHRLIDVKRRIEVIGVEPQSITMLFGQKKTAYSAQESTLFAAEALAADAVAIETVANLDIPVQPDSVSKASEIDSLQTSDLLSLLMSGGESTTRFDKLANRLVKEYGSRAVADERDADRLAEELKIPRSRAMQIIAAFELGRRFFGKSQDDSPVLRGPEDVYHHVSEMSNLRREQFRGLYLNSKQRLVADEVISIGTLTSAVLHPREVFRPAVTHRAVSLILVHNHPSGDPEPSGEDIELTRQIASAGKILGIDLLDHLIIGSEGWFSMADAGIF